jgi:hypothetical protein
MLYQLPNGKVIHMSIDEYLSLTDDDVRFLVSVNAGETIINPFQGSVLQDNIKDDVEYEEEEVLDETDVIIFDIDEEKTLNDFLSEYDIDPEE